uniref:Uncharacterized protein n=1 Tax=Pyricularia oryzae (strain P131) TaxID=1143193 RepID=L7JDB7_PYRO1
MFFTAAIGRPSSEANVVRLKITFMAQLLHCVGLVFEIPSEQLNW